MLCQSGDRPAGKAVPQIAGVFPQSLPENLLRVGIHGSGTPGAGFRDQAVESEAEVILDPAHEGSHIDRKESGDFSGGFSFGTPENGSAAIAHLRVVAGLDGLGDLPELSG